jgi:hypothetical protein
MKKTLLVLGGVAVLAVAGVAGFAYYALFTNEREKNRQKTEAARAARWQKNGVENETENILRDEKNE